MPGSDDGLAVHVDVDSGLRSFSCAIFAVCGARAGVRRFLLFAARAFFLYFVRVFPSSNSCDGVIIWVPTRKVKGGGSFVVVHSA